MSLLLLGCPFYRKPRDFTTQTDAIAYRLTGASIVFGKRRHQHFAVWRAIVVVDDKKRAIFRLGSDGKPRVGVLRNVGLQLSCCQPRRSFADDDFSVSLSFINEKPVLGFHLVELLGVQVSVDSLESMNLRMAADVEAFRDQQAAPPAREEGELLVLSADATGVFSWLAHERQTRAGNGSKKRPVICLMDGKHKLWERKEQFLGEDVVEILDFWHFLERLREVSKLLCDTDVAAEAFVKERLTRVLAGDLGRVIGGLRQMLKKRRLSKRNPSKKSQATIQSAITYFQNNRSRMRYGDYLREGYPIASRPTCGRCPIEGSCRLVVEDRLDRTGMRWSLDGALAMLANRTTSLSDDWNDYQTFRITREQNRIYPTAT